MCILCLWEVLENKDNMRSQLWINKIKQLKRKKTLVLIKSYEIM